MTKKETIQQNSFSKKNNTGIKAVKTYNDFAVSSLQGSSTSLARMIIDEKKKQEIKKTHSLVKKKNIFMIVLSATLVILGVIVVVGIILFSITKKDEWSKTKVAISSEAIIQYDYKIEVNITNISRRELVRFFQDNIRETAIPVGDIKIFSIVNVNNQGLKRLATARDFFDKLDTRMPLQLERTLYRNFTTGILSSDFTLPFLILNVNSFEVAYSRMLEWERTLLYDIGELFDLNKMYFSRHFVDLNLFNNDTRVILNQEGKVVFGYAFTSIDTLIFFTSSSAFNSLKSAVQSYKKRH